MELPNHETLATRLEHGVLHVTLNRPERKNAMNARMLQELLTLFEQVNGQTRAVVMRGAGGTFCAGADLQDMAPGGGADRSREDTLAEIRQRNRVFGELVSAANDLAQPLVVVVEGAAMGGGFGLVCVSDIALCHDEAKLGMPETRRGLLPAQIAAFAVQRMGFTHARSMALTGTRVRGPEAVALGLVHQSHPTTQALEGALEARLQDLLACAPEATRLTKTLLRAVTKTDLGPLLDEAADLFAEASLGDEAAEGITAFLTKRRPRWTVEGQS